MTPVRFFGVCGVVLALGCSKEKSFVEPSPPLAAITWANVVPDTGQVDMRVVDIVSNAGFFDVNFRGTLTYPQGIEAGQRRIKVFMSSTDPAISQTVLLDTTYTFAESQRYGFYVTGFARTSQTPARQAVITTLNPPTPPTGQFAIRVVNLSPSFAGAVPALVDTTVHADAFVRKINTLPAGAPDIVNVGYGDMSAYVTLDTGRYRLALTPTGAATPVFVQVPVPPGALATSSTGAIGGSLVPGSVLTAIIIPRSVPASAAPQTRPSSKATDTTLAEASRRVSRSNDTVTVQSGSVTILTNRSQSKPDSTLRQSGTGATTGVNAGDVVFASGATQPEYNGWQVVIVVADSLSCNPTNALDTKTKCAATNDTATTRFRFRYRIAGTPASPATGTPVYRIFPPLGTADFVLPFVTFVVDKRP